MQTPFCLSATHTLINDLLASCRLLSTLSAFSHSSTKDIKVGESIPERVYDAIDRASHFLFVISHASVVSRWVQDELSAAKVRQHASEGLRVLPILLDDVKLPRTVAHIKYADFRDWRNAEAYRVALRELLDSIGHSGLLPSTNLATWYLKNLGILRRCEAAVTEALYHLRGAMMATAADSHVGVWTTFKNLVWEGDLLPSLSEFDNALQAHPAPGALKEKLSMPLSHVIELIGNDIAHWVRLWSGSNRNERTLKEAAQRIHEVTGQLGLLNELMMVARVSVEDALFASFE